jgi:hypothetical protein
MAIVPSLGPSLTRDRNDSEVIATSLVDFFQNRNKRTPRHVRAVRELDPICPTMRLDVHNWAMISSACHLRNLS